MEDIGFVGLCSYKISCAVSQPPYSFIEQMSFMCSDKHRVNMSEDQGIYKSRICL